MSNIGEELTSGQCLYEGCIGEKRGDARHVERPVVILEGRRRHIPLHPPDYIWPTNAGCPSQ